MDFMGGKKRTIEDFFKQSICFWFIWWHFKKEFWRIFDKNLITSTAIRAPIVLFAKQATAKYRSKKTLSLL
jgi:hypothetical protein